MSETHFLNVDLDIESETDIDILVEELSKTLVLMTHHVVNGVVRASFEPHQFDIELIVVEFIESIKKLGPHAKKQWDISTKREFNIGFGAGSSPRSYVKEISSVSLAQLVDANISLGITIYPAE